MSQPSQALIKEIFIYNPQTGIFTWRKRGLHLFASEASMRRWNTRRSGKVAGSLWANKNGYKCYRLRFLGYSIESHRAAFIYMTGSAPVSVDHKNRNPMDNKWENLRSSDWLDNAKNKTINRRNKTGESGVWWDKSRKNYQACVTCNYKRYRLGRFDSKSDAIKAVRKKRKELGFTDGHGEKRPY